MRSRHLPSAFVTEDPIPTHSPPWAGSVARMPGVRSWTLTPWAGLPMDESRTVGRRIRSPKRRDGQASVHADCEWVESVGVHTMTSNLYFGSHAFLLFFHPSLSLSFEGFGCDRGWVSDRMITVYFCHELPSCPIYAIKRDTFRRQYSVGELIAGTGGRNEWIL